MLSNKNRVKLTETFSALPELDRKLVALKAICCQYSARNHEKTFVDAVIKSGMTDETGKALTEKTYQERVKRLKQLGIAENKSELSISKELHHDFLILISEAEKTWVFSMVDTFYGSKIPDFSDMYNQNIRFYENTSQIRARLMKAVYANETDYFLANRNNLKYCAKVVSYLDDIFAHAPITIEWLQSRNELIQLYLCVMLLGEYYCEASPTLYSNEVLAFFCRHHFDSIEHDYLHYYSAIIHLSLGNIDKAADHCKNIKEIKSGYSLTVQASIAFLTSRFDLATTLYRKALPALRKQYGSRGYYFDNTQGLLHNLCLAYADNGLSQIDTNTEQYCKYAANHMFMPMDTVYDLLPLFLVIEQGRQKEAERWLLDFGNKRHALKTLHPLTLAVYHLLGYTANKEYIRKNQDNLHALAQQCIKTNHLLAAHIVYELIDKIEQHQAESTIFFEQSAIKLRFLELIHVKDAWEYSFQALEGLLLEESTAITTTKQKRLLWLINPDKQDVDVIEQSMTKSGQWSAGRAVSLKKLKYYHQYEQYDYLSTDDKRVIDCLIHTYDSWYDEYQFDEYRTLLALVGHRNIAHHQNKDVSMELVHGEPELYIEENKKGYHLSLSHWLEEAGLILEPESLSKYRVIDFSQAFVNIGQVLTKKGLSIPTQAKEKVLRVIQHAKRDIKLHVGIKDIDIPEISGDPTPCIQLLPIKEGIKATLWVRPLPNHGTYCKIGSGKEHVMLLLTENGNETRTRVARNFKAEQDNLETLLAQCPSLARHEVGQGEYEIDNPEETLETLSEMQNYAATHPLVIEWPQGQTFKIKQRIFSDNLSLKITSETNWFAYHGEITLSDGEILDMKELLESIETKAYGRFIRLGNGEFIELTSQLKKQLSLLHAMSDGNKINPLGAQILSDIAAEAENTVFDEGWQSHLKKMKTMRSHNPKVPSTLQASLRDYQIEGFQYLSRLTHWGIGACLADDMGLGKTIQTIALLLERAKNGASLVIAPTSVGFNWIEELNKFAPSLNVYNLRTDDKSALIDKAGKFDVIICSYGLLQHNETLLTEKAWETIVLDEAQAIKNANTQRWKTVMKLRGKNRIALSGTPIENHLGELWSIFSFINPGLLGTIKSFQSKYSTPIENGQSSGMVQVLKALVSPYILRRIKSEVLSELPPKTEQIIHVEQTEEEAVFYEALRRRAEERMVSLLEENNRIGVFAEITKLRQACCDSSLVDSTLLLENSKLNAFIETVKNIIDNGHKALVFSQYVSFLQIVKKRIDEEKISHQYLDGSTSPAQRKKSVQAFQAGEGDLFLLSLRAGGSGLNLTAADYVIHLDPWWNPAVEDQASDRAHRIGQERPVTVYRFIMQNTIEEKIIALHQQKRNLANELLSEQGVSGKLSNDDLMSLIVGGNN
ncbi:hypothetical protein TUM19329_36670 (plasmid) [Legionella antarctica]|uniref:ATP-dependent helicase n=1 Tax=Legionella antarctica TaxID=2708020 RepID=A0A6F8TBF2_9GAMM|nr:DEAD/DEAH box helicase [Legionella antarctica]BCA97306.1 hypothetical protein TUM19329_36670 [Legionella antarctica]